MTGVRVYIDATWMQKGLDALNETFCVDDQTRRDMIQFLFDEGFWDKEKLSWTAAVDRFNDNLNVRRPAFFKIGEVWALMKRFRRYQLLDVMLDDLGCYPRREKPTEERRLELLERIAANQERLLAAIKVDAADLERLDAEPVHRRIHPTVAEGEGSFSRGHGGF